MSIPRATLRLQLHRDFRFDDALAQSDYFSALGISHLYVSPIFTARPGSMHGYDVADPCHVNPELGGEEGLRRLVQALHVRKMRLIVDIVPNHMALGEHNPWWCDVLLWGRHSAYADWFDIDWQANDPALAGKILLPVLGEAYNKLLHAGELRLAFDAARLVVVSPGMRLPLAPEHYGEVLSGTPSSRLAGVVAAFRKVSEATAPSQRQTLAAQAWRELADVMEQPAARADAAAALAQFSPSGPEGRSALHALLERQHYRLCDWRNAGDEINWRRFFEIGDLIGMRVEREDVFEAMHALLFRLAGEGLIDGVRLDHIDGLAEPAAYVHRLRERLGQLCPVTPVYIVAEKILGAEESLPTGWGLDGTTGYDFMDQVAALQHDEAGAAVLDDVWRTNRAEPEDFGELVRAARRCLLERNFASQFNALVHCLHALARADTATRDVTLMVIRRCMLALLVCFPVYRTYGTRLGCDSRDRAVIRAAAAQARPSLARCDWDGLEVVVDWLAWSPSSAAAEDTCTPLRWRALTLFQQLTPPLTAKSVEDTAFYRYGRLLSRNEVGADPSRLALPPSQFHRLTARRGRDFPHAMVATATHDHKRGEDARMRLAVLSEVPERWQTALQAWQAINRTEPNQIDPADEVMLVQTLIGVWPLETEPAAAMTDDAAAGTLADITERVAQWQRKALREAKRRSDWIAPDVDYEARCEQFLRYILRPDGDNAFLPALRRFVAGIAAAGVINSLGQTMLRLTVPGVPDLYQGCEFWDFSLVDPDNRRPVDFACRRQALQKGAGLPLTTADWHSGVCKQQLIRSLLHFRAGRPALFCAGDYVPLAVEGDLSDKLIAFARCHGDVKALVLCSRHAARLLGEAPALPLIAPSCWGNTAVRLPSDWHEGRWQAILSRTQGTIRQQSVAVQEVLFQFPVEMLLLSP